MTVTTKKRAAPLVVSVILHWNRYEETRTCLESFQAVRYRPLRVVVVDNGSSDGSAQRLANEFTDVHFIFNHENLGFARGNNVGIRWAIEMGAEYVLVLNNDTLVSPNFLHFLVSAGETNPDVAALSGTVYYLDDDSASRRISYAGGHVSFWRAAAVYYRHDEIDHQTIPRPPETVGFIGGCSMLIKRHALQQVGLFDDRFFFGVEDIDYSIRLIKAGFRLLYVPQSVIWHKKAGSRSYAAGEFYNAIVSKAILMRKHCPEGTFVLWWTMYALRTRLTLRRLVQATIARYGLSDQRSGELRAVILKSLRAGFSRNVRSGFEVPWK